MRSWGSLPYLLLYLAAIVTANLVVARFGRIASVPSAAVLIGCDMAARDHLHEAWVGPRLWLRMSLLIAAGGLLSWLLYGQAGQIAVASTLAFVSAASVDALVYGWARCRGASWALRVNGSNALSSVVDSLVFASLAFGGLQVTLALLQLAAKFAGGLLWSLALRREDR